MLRFCFPPSLTFSDWVVFNFQLWNHRVFFFWKIDVEASRLTWVWDVSPSLIRGCVLYWEGIGGLAAAAPLNAWIPYIFRGLLEYSFSMRFLHVSSWGFDRRREAKLGNINWSKRERNQNKTISKFYASQKSKIVNVSEVRVLSFSVLISLVNIV